MASNGRNIRIAGVVLSVLGRALCVVSSLDSRVRSEMLALGNGYSFSMGIDNGPYLFLGIKDGRLVNLKKTGADADKAKLVIRYKDVTGAIPVLTGKMCAAVSFAQHRMQVWGNIPEAMRLVRAINIVEAYLFPRAMMEKALLRVPKKEISSLRVFAGLVGGK